MLTLSLLRHAKSSWDDLDLDDFDRPLAKRGTKAAPVVARFIMSQDLRPDVILCSSAVRTRATHALLVAEFGPPPPETHFRENLYLASPEIILNEIRATETAAKHIMIIGHNPGLHMLALQLTGSGDKSLIRHLTQEFPTAALAVFKISVASWTKVDTSLGELIDFKTPRSL